MTDSFHKNHLIFLQTLNLIFLKLFVKYFFYFYKYILYCLNHVPLILNLNQFFSLLLFLFFIVIKLTK
ncbi:MAG: hypothetical protein B6D58_08890 [candidate division Zixibacteria bacterium 4484_95]|nr:MAG: hypothetical protein B6D58_08890 [candidate division Zixibacteria bacterium 4484_95]